MSLDPAAGKTQATLQRVPTMTGSNGLCSAFQCHAARFWSACDMKLAQC